MTVSDLIRNLRERILADPTCAEWPIMLDVWDDQGEYFLRQHERIVLVTLPNAIAIRGFGENE